jgi:hypothetical protein
VGTSHLRSPVRRFQDTAATCPLPPQITSPHWCGCSTLCHYVASCYNNPQRCWVSARTQSISSPSFFRSLVQFSVPGRRLQQRWNQRRASQASPPYLIDSQASALTYTGTFQVGQLGVSSLLSLYLSRITYLILPYLIYPTLPTLVSLIYLTSVYFTTLPLTNLLWYYPP